MVSRVPRVASSDANWRNLDLQTPFPYFFFENRWFRFRPANDSRGLKSRDARHVTSFRVTWRNLLARFVLVTSPATMRSTSTTTKATMKTTIRGIKTSRESVICKKRYKDREKEGGKKIRRTREREREKALPHLAHNVFCVVVCKSSSLLLKI